MQGYDFDGAIGDGQDDKTDHSDHQHLMVRVLNFSPDTVQNNPSRLRASAETLISELVEGCPMLIVRKFTDIDTNEESVDVILSGVAEDHDAPDAIAEMTRFVSDLVNNPEFVLTWLDGLVKMRMTGPPVADPAVIPDEDDALRFSTDAERREAALRFLDAVQEGVVDEEGLTEDDRIAIARQDEADGHGEPGTEPTA